MVVVVGVEVGAVALYAGAAYSAIERGVAIAVDAYDTGAVATGVADEAVVVMNHNDRVAAVAIETEGAAGDGCRVVMAMTGGSGEVISPMALDAGRISGDGNDPRPAAWFLQDRRYGADVAVAAFVGMDRHRVVGRMATDAERGVDDVTQAWGGAMVDADMGVGRFLILMATQTEDRGLIGIGDDHLHRGLGGGEQADFAGGVVAGDAAVVIVGMGGQDAVPIQDCMAFGTEFGVGLAQIGGQIELHGMLNGADGGAVTVVVEETYVAGDAIA